MATLPDITALFVTLEDENSDLRYASPGLSKFEFTSTVKGTLVALYGVYDPEAPFICRPTIVPVPKEVRLETSSPPTFPPFPSATISVEPLCIFKLRFFVELEDTISDNGLPEAFLT